MNEATERFANLCKEKANDFGKWCENSDSSSFGALRIANEPMELIDYQPQAIFGGGYERFWVGYGSSDDYIARGIVVTHLFRDGEYRGVEDVWKNGEYFEEEKIKNFNKEL